MVMNPPAHTRLRELEDVIDGGLRTFYEVGRALMEIRDSGLYSIEKGGVYLTFEAYCQQRWQLKQTRAYQYIDAAKLAERLKSSTIVELPANEAQARELASVPTDRQTVVWEKALKTAPGGVITASHIKIVVESERERRDVEIARNSSALGRAASNEHLKGFEAAIRAMSGDELQLMFLLCYSHVSKAVLAEASEHVKIANDIGLEIAERKKQLRF